MNVYFLESQMSTIQYGQLLLFRDWPFNKHGCFDNVGVVLHPDMGIRKGLPAPEPLACKDCASARGES